MSQINPYIILNHIDSPLKILFWTKGEIVLFISPFFIGMILDQFLVGVGLSFLNVWAVSVYKKKFGKGQLQAVMYWYLPKSKKLKNIPSAGVREYVG